MNFNGEAFLKSLGMALEGWGGVFGVIIAIVLIVMVFNKIFSRKK